jgi:hypothetical protein
VRPTSLPPGSVCIALGSTNLGVVPGVPEEQASAVGAAPRHSCVAVFAERPDRANIFGSLLVQLDRPADERSRFFVCRLEHDLFRSQAEVGVQESNPEAPDRSMSDQHLPDLSEAGRVRIVQRLDVVDVA